MHKNSYALMASAMAASMMDTLKYLKFVEAIPQPFDPSRAVKRYRTGKTYPHSSARQQARYARQIAAGKLHMDGV